MEEGAKEDSLVSGVVCDRSPAVSVWWCGGVECVVVVVVAAVCMYGGSSAQVR